MPVHISPDGAAAAILDFWFGEVGAERWYAKSDALDAAISRRFGAVREAVLATKAAAWRDTPDHLLAAVIALDQFSRNLQRGSARAFAGDTLARELTYLALDREWDRAMPLDQRQFLLMPLMHSEVLADQQRSLDEFSRLGNDETLKYAQLHHDQIARFGRFPGRNAALGRRTTEGEKAVIEQQLF